jgi:hypothetical protein
MLSSAGGPLHPMTLHASLPGAAAAAAGREGQAQGYIDAQASHGSGMDLP